MTDEKPRFLDKPRNVRLLIRALYAVCIVVFAADFVVHRHIDHPWEELPGFYAVYGLVACVILVRVARELRKLIMRRQDHYDD